MLNTLLNDAKINDSFLSAVRFYRNAPVFLLFNMKMKKDIYDILDHIRIVAFSKEDFINTFKDNNSGRNSDSFNYDSTDLKKFKNNSQNQNNLINYYNSNFGQGFHNSYRNNRKSSSERSPHIIDINKVDVYYENSSNVKAFITVKDTYILRGKEDLSEEETLYYKVYLKDSYKNTIWNSDVITSPKKISNLINNANLSQNIDYLKYFISEDFRSAIVSLPDPSNNDYYLNIRFIGGVANASTSNITGGLLSENSGSIVGIFGTEYSTNFQSVDSALGNSTIDMSNAITTHLTCNYGNISLKLKNDLSKSVLSRSLYKFDRLDSLFSLENVYEKIIEDYYENKIDFNITLSLNFEFNNDSYTIPNHTLKLSRENIDSIVNRYSGKFEASKSEILNNVNVKYSYINTRIVRHDIDLENVSGVLDNIKLSEINNINTIFLELDKDSSELSNNIQLSSINSLTELRNITKASTNNSSDTLSFYTLSPINTTRQNSSFTYKLVFFIGDENITARDIIGRHEINEDLDKINYNSKLIESNSIFKNLIELTVSNFKENVNIDLSEENSLLLDSQHLNLRMGSIDRLSNISRFFGYDSVYEFLSGCALNFNYISKISKNRINFNPDFTDLSNLISSGTIGNHEKMYDFNEIFRLNDTTQIASDDVILSNDVYLRDLKKSPHNDYNVIKNSGIFDFIFSSVTSKSRTFDFDKIISPNSTIFVSYDFTIYPIPYILNKYKNKGLNELKNVSNYFNDENEASSVDRIFYDYVYNDNPSLSFSKFIELKESFFEPGGDKRLFYEHLKGTLDGFMPDWFYVYDNDNFSDLINASFNSNETSNLSNIYSNTRYEFYQQKMIDDSLSSRVMDFPYAKNRINVLDASSTEIYFNLPQILDFDLDIINIIRRSLSTSANKAEFNNALNDTSSRDFNVRLALSPIVSSSNTELGVSFNDIKSTTNFINVVTNGNELTLHPKINSYKNNDELFWRGVNASSYKNYGQDSHSLSIITDDLLNNNYKDYFADFFNEALMLGFNLLFDIRLNVAISIRVKTNINQDSNQEYDYWEDYYQISLLGNNNNRSIESLNGIYFIRNT